MTHSITSSSPPRSTGSSPTRYPTFSVIDPTLAASRADIVNFVFGLYAACSFFTCSSQMWLMAVAVNFPLAPQFIVERGWGEERRTRRGGGGEERKSNFETL